MGAFYVITALKNNIMKMLISKSYFHIFIYEHKNESMLIN